MALKEKFIRDVGIISISGKLMSYEDTKAVHDKVKSLIADGIKKIVIDLSKVTWLNSQGIGTLMASFTSLKNVGGQLKIAGATEKVNSLFMITQVIKVFDCYETVDRAVATFQSC